MLDLNVHIFSVDSYGEDSTTIMEFWKPPGASRTDSNVASKAGDENSNCSSTFIFDIMKREGDGNSTAPEFRGSQTFPVTGDSKIRNLEPGYGSPSRIQWLKLASSEPRGQQSRSRRGPRSRSSQYRGVTFYRRTGRWESHIWDCGKQVYLGGFDTALAAARAYDQAAIKFRGSDADINFSISDYKEDIKLMKNLTKEEVVHKLRRQSSGTLRESLKHKGISPHKCDRWKAPMANLFGKNLEGGESSLSQGYEKSIIQFNRREPSVLQGEIIAKGDVHDLDLSLRLFTSTSSPKRDQNTGGRA